MFISGRFLQSKEWAEFQESLGKKIFWVNGALVVKMNFAFGFYFLYSPKGPLFEMDDIFLKKIREIAKKENAFFYRAEPPTMPPKTFQQFRDKEPKCTLITDILKPEDELLSAMHEKTRYNIRLSQKHGVKVGKSEIRNPKSEKQFEQFYTLLNLTSARQGIKLHSKNYYEKLAEFNEIFIAYLGEAPLAGAMVNFYNDTATYLHGGSDEKYKNLMAPQLLHWEIIKTAKERGFHYYDWWGVDEKKWPGLTRFKRGFDGAEICAPGTFDLPLDQFWYFWYKLFRR